MNTIDKSLNWLNNLSWTYILLTGIFLAGGYLLWERYQQQLFSYLPYLVFLLCPLMHIFMHKGHGKHKNHDDHGEGHEQ
jgi:hypothetical protein